MRPDGDGLTDQERYDQGMEVRRAVLERVLPDIALLEEVTGESFADWRADTGRGDYASRAARQDGA